MNKYRIGRIHQPWVNFTPPIRGGVYRPIANDDSATDEEDSQSESSSWDYSSATSIDDEVNGVVAPSSGQTTCSSRRSNGGRISASVSSPDSTGLSYASSTAKATRPTKSSTPAPVSSPNSHQHTPTSYTTSVVQKEIDHDLQHYPSLDPLTQQSIILKYQKLHQTVQDEGFYNCRYSEYGKEFIRYSLIFALFITALRAEWYITSAALLGLFWHQIMFTAHDAGHMGITHNFVADTLIGMFVADFCCGLSIGWWKSSHNVHHLVTNHPVRPKARLPSSITTLT